MDIGQYRDLILGPILRDIGLHSVVSEKLMLMIAAHESKFHYIRQETNSGYGPAYGIFQMEENTLKDLWENFLAYRPFLSRELESLSISRYPRTDPRQLYSPYYATVATRFQLLRFPSFPPVNDIEALARYLKKYWNTEGGKARWEDYHDAYLELVGE